MNFIVLIFTMFFSMLAQALPELSEQEAGDVIRRDMSSDVLYWNPFPLPYEAEQGGKDPNAEVLAGLLRQNLVTRTKVTHSDKEDSAPYWLYRGTRSSYEDFGFYYGRPHFKKILSVSEPVKTRGEIIAQVHVAWSVIDIQPWVNDVSLKKARTLKRSLESATKPFHKYYYLEYIEGTWLIWRPKKVDDSGF